MNGVGQAVIADNLTLPDQIGQFFAREDFTGVLYQDVEEFKLVFSQPLRSPVVK
jgi:hypothetical protein